MSMKFFNTQADALANPPVAANEVQSLQVGKEYYLGVSVQDVRTNPATPGGVFSAYFDILYATGVGTFDGSSFAHGTYFMGNAKGQVFSASIYDAGGTDVYGAPPNPGNPYALFAVPFHVSALGTGSFSLTGAITQGMTGTDPDIVQFWDSLNAVTDIQFVGPGPTGGAIPVVGNQAPSTTTLKSSANATVFGQPITLTATVAPGSGSGTPTGSVTFMDGASTLGTGTLSGGAASVSTSSLGPGTHTITAVYNGDVNYAGSTSSAVSQIVSQAVTTTSVASTAATAVFGQSVTLTATIAVTAPGAGTPTGSVSFNDGTTVLNTVPLSGNTASYTTTSLAVASHTITAVYGGDTDFTASTSGPLTEAVSKSFTQTALTAAPNPSSLGQSVTFTAAVSATAPGAGTPTGSVNFLDGTTYLGSGPLAGGTATFSTSALAAGSHSMTAVYVGDGDFMFNTSPVVTQVVGKAATATNIASSASPSVFGQTVTFTATVASAAGGTATGSVTFMDGQTALKSVPLTFGTATFSTSSLAVGSHSITAVYGGDTNFAGSTSNSAAQAVNPANTTASLASSPNPSTFGQSVAFTATVSASTPGSGTPTGSAAFMDGQNLLGSVSLAGGTAIFTTSSLAVGSHAITVVYGGGPNFVGSTSGTAVTQVVNKAVTTASVASAANPSAFGQSVTFTATVSAGGSTAAAATGSVNFMDGAMLLGSGSLAGGTATFSTTSLAVGSHAITAVYTGDASFAGSTSATAVTQVVNKAATTTNVVSSLNPSAFGQSVTFTATVSASGPGAGAATGGVNFMDGTTSLGSGTLTFGTATFTTSTLAIGSHNITAVYNGDGNFTGSTSSPALAQVVNKVATTTIVASGTNPSAFGQSVTFTATVSIVAPGTGTATGSVNFMDGTTLLGSGPLTGGAATFSTSSLAAGSHAITAVYSGDTNFGGSTSATAVTQVVNKATTATSIASSPNPSLFGQSVTFTATVSAGGATTGTATGSVSFMDGTTTLKSVSLANGTATFSASTLAVGSHTITAVYAGDANFSTSTSSQAATQVVNQAATTTTVASSANPSTFGQSITLTATVSASAGLGHGHGERTLHGRPGARRERHPRGRHGHVQHIVAGGRLPRHHGGL